MEICPSGDAASTTGERDQQVKLHGTEVDVATRDPHRPAAHVDGQIRDLVSNLVRITPRRAPQERLDSREELEDANRLHDVVVGTEPEALHLVYFLKPRKVVGDGSNRRYSVRMFCLRSHSAVRPACPPGFTPSPTSR